MRVNPAISSQEKHFFNDPHFQTEFDKNVRKKHFAKEEVIMWPGDEIVFVPIVISGSIRILKDDDKGHEIFLYHIYPRQTCAMSLNCCHGHKASIIKAVAEDDTELYMVPANLVEEWARFKEWKDFINETYHSRFNELLNVIDLIAFNNMDHQLLHYLQERCRAHNTNALFITHQQIADELRTHREAISRLLRQMEEKGLLKLGRHTIELL